MSKTYINTDETIKKAAKEAAKEAIKEYDKEKKDEQRKKVFHNTRLLLSHYNDLKSHVDNAIDDICKLKTFDLHETEYFNMDRSLDELYILSIKKSKTKTLIMVAHIDMAMETLKNKRVKLGDSYKYEALEMFYIDELSYEDIQEKLNCSKNTPSRWINQMVNELSVLLFGIDGMKLDMVQ